MTCPSLLGGDKMLNGVNNKCAKCVEKCKQWQQIKVIVCPFFKRLQRQAQENGGNDPSLIKNIQVGELPVKQIKSNLEPLNAKFGGVI